MYEDIIRKLESEKVQNVRKSLSRPRQVVKPTASIVVIPPEPVEKQEPLIISDKAQTISFQDKIDHIRNATRQIRPPKIKKIRKKREIIELW